MSILSYLATYSGMISDGVVTLIEEGDTTTFSYL